MQSRIRQVLKWIPSLPAAAAIGLIALYQTVFSPLKFFLTGGTGSCRFYPTCSCYARESVRCHGLVIGLCLSLWRLLKCQPFHPGGFDPVPDSVSSLFRGRRSGLDERADLGKSPAVEEGKGRQCPLEVKDKPFGILDSR